MYYLFNLYIFHSVNLQFQSVDAFDGGIPIPDAVCVVMFRS